MLDDRLRFVQVAQDYGLNTADPELENLFQLGLTSDRLRSVCERSGMLTAVEVQERLNQTTRDVAMFFRVRL